nr:hypothetical protein CFP56_75360 [Quercus suber]
MNYTEHNEADEPSDIHAMIVRRIDTFQGRLNCGRPDSARQSWRDTVRPAKFGRRIVLRPGQLVNVQSALSLNDLYCAEAKLLNSIHEHMIDNMLKDENDDELERVDQEDITPYAVTIVPEQNCLTVDQISEQVTPMQRSAQIAYFRGIHDLVREATDRCAKSSRLIEYLDGSTTPTLNYFSEDQQSLISEIFDHNPFPNPAELSMLTRIFRFASPIGAKSWCKFE